MQLVDVDVVGVELPQRIVERADDAFRRRAAGAPAERRLGADNDLIAWHRLDCFAQQVFGAV
jgi:hypothetical protein